MTQFTTRLGKVAAILTCILNIVATSNARKPGGKPSFVWDDSFASPGASLVLEEMRRVPRDFGTLVWYRLKADGFAKGEKLTLWIRRGSNLYDWSATVGDDGYLQFKSGDGKTDLGALVALAFYRDEGFGVVHGSGGVNALLMGGFAEGHPVQVAVVSNAADKRAHAKAVPIPLRAEGTGGCAASAELQFESGLVFLVFLKGFAPGEAVQVQSQYGEELKADSKSASPSGELVFPVTFEKGARGTASLSATSERCTVKLEYKVGIDAVVH